MFTENIYCSYGYLWLQRSQIMVVRESQDRPVIPQFYAGREVFITGATGFMGKVLVERLLATCPNIGYLHLLMRTKKDVSPDSRLRELKESKVFDVLRRNNPEQLDKLRIVSGDITKPHLGLSDRFKTDLEKVMMLLLNY
ncbi:unnamed protein product [Diatraea saccharalis]|uniref:Fatty acyl-CoA reductase n=1 Tax=Diatraea saccharalis TaxID=40085 RepID=A0A9N9R7D4_9NEOP|nr:unnamed protein product [Diatraea saccharalis]